MVVIYELLLHFMYYYETRNCQLSASKQDQDIKILGFKSCSHFIVVVKGLKEE